MSAQGDLFSERRPAAVMDRPTSIAAAESIRGRAGVIRNAVRRCVEIRGRLGATCDEIEEAIGLRHQTASARVNELYRMGTIVDSGTRRPTRSGRDAIVWVTP